MTIELKINVRNESSNLIKKFKLHKEDGELVMESGDPLLSRYVNETVSQFSADVDEVIITAKLVW